MASDGYDGDGASSSQVTSEFGKTKICGSCAPSVPSIAAWYARRLRTVLPRCIACSRVAAACSCTDAPICPAPAPLSPLSPALVAATCVCAGPGCKSGGAASFTYGANSFDKPRRHASSALSRIFIFMLGSTAAQRGGMRALSSHDVGAEGTQGFERGGPVPLRSRLRPSDIF